MTDAVTITDLYKRRADLKRDLAPVATQAMLEDDDLRDAVAYVRRIRSRDEAWWPHVEHLLDIDGRPAWFVDDLGYQLVVVGGTWFRADDMPILSARIREAASEAAARRSDIRRGETD